MINNKYLIVEQINKGSYGTVFKAQHVRTNEFVAIKMENNNNVTNSLKNEAKIYQYLNNIPGFPSLKMYGTFQGTNYIVTELMGQSLHDTIKHYKALNLKTTIYLGVQIIELVQIFHSKLLVHRDIKPSNFLFGLDAKMNNLHLIDFGFAKRYSYDGSHIPETNISNIIGSINYVSLNIHKGIEPCRRDDLESCIYIILTMLFGTLEWFNKKNLHEIYTLKQNIINIPEIPNFIKTILTYVRQLTFEQTPNYKFIIETMLVELNNLV